MTERYVVTTASGDPAVRTNSMPEAERLMVTLRGEIIDLEADR